MSYYIIDLVFHSLLGIACIVVSIFGLYLRAWPAVLMQLVIAACCIVLVVRDIAEIRTELWWNKQIKLKQSFIDYNDVEDFE